MINRRRIYHYDDAKKESREALFFCDDLYPGKQSSLESSVSQTLLERA